MKPRFGAQLDRSHPAAAGLRAFFAFNEAMGPYATDLSRGIRGTFTNSPTWVPGTRYGAPQIQFGSGGTSYIALGNPAALDFSTSSGLTVIWGYKCNVKPSYVNRYFVSKGGEWQIDCLGPTSGGVRFVLNGGGGAGGTVAESRTVVDGEQYAYAITYDQSSHFSQVIREGIVTASTTMSAFGSIPASSANVNLGSAAGTLAWDGPIQWIGFWNYVLPLGLIREIQARPFGLTTSSRALIFALSGGGSSLTWSVSDSATASESTVVASIWAASDSGTATDGPSSASTWSASDTGSGSETPLVASAWVVTETASGADVAAGSGFDGATLTWSTSDSGTATDSIVSAKALATADTATGTDSALAAFGLVVTDTGSGSETVLMPRTLVVTDTATGSDSAAGSGFTVSVIVTTTLFGHATIRPLSTTLDPAWTTVKPL